MKPVRMFSLCLVLLAGSFGINQQGLAESGTSEQKETTFSYETVIKETSHNGVDGALKAASQLLTLQKTHQIGAYALAGRIRSDYDRLEGALQSQGYYGGTVSLRVTVGGHEFEGKDPAMLTALEQDSGKKTVRIVASVTLGPLFHIGSLELLAPQKKSVQKPPEKVSLSAKEMTALGIKAGDKAIAADILASQTRLGDSLLEEGYGTATVSRPQALLHPARREITVRILVEKGPRLVIGPLSFKGLGHVRQSYVRRRILLHQGELYQPSGIEKARLDLSSTGLFSSIEINNAPPVISVSPEQSEVKNINKAMPLSIGFQEGKRRRVSGEVGYSTDLGGRLGASWLHRNLLGNGERLKVSALATGLGGSAQQGLGYDGYVDFTKPDFMDRERNLNVRVEAVRQLLYSYHQTAFLVKGGFSQPVGDEWNVNGAVALEQEKIRQFGRSQDYFIVSLPIGADYDTTHRKNAIEPATHGVKISISGTPSESMEHKTSFFAILNGQISTYFDLHNLGISRPGRSVIALRGAVGSIQGATTWDVPPDQRLYAGGQATVRGYRYQGVGPQFRHSKYAIGGSSMDAATVEYRQRLFKSFGTALFADAGQVGHGSVPGHGKVRVGYGAGVRYFTPIGPVRVDIALPMHRPNRGDKWELYIGLGETF